MSRSKYRLPTTIKPLSYNITIYTNPDENESFDFGGYETITINITKQHLTIKNEPFMLLIHCGSKVNMTNVTLSLLNDPSTYSAQSIDYDKSTQIANILFPINNDKISTNIGQLFIEYTAKYRTDKNGVYLSTYSYADQKIKNIVTQFQPVFTRTAFPCFDEPSFKALFSFSFIIPSDVDALYNTQKISTTMIEKSKKKIVKFATSPIMSTYLNAFVIGTYNKKTIKNPYFLPNYAINHSFYYPLNENLSHIEKPFASSLKLLHWYGTSKVFNYSWTRFGLNKEEDILEHDRHTAMEHSGLITYDRSHFSDDQKAQLVVGHEISHQWFGNLVTCDWWSDIFINEGFARFWEYKSVNEIRSDLNVFLLRAMRTNLAMNADLSFFAQPIVKKEQNVQTMDECEDVFDAVVYNKGAAVLLMIYEFIGHDPFMSASRQFLKEFEFDNANVYDLVRVFDNYYYGQSGTTNFSLFFDSWLRKAGIPILSVSIDYNDQRKVTLTVSQQRMLKKSQFSKGQIDSFWPIPLIIQTSNPLIVHKLGTLNGKSAKIVIDREINKKNQAEFYLFNAELINVFRTIYDEQSLNFLILHFEHLSFWQKFNLIADYSAFAEFGFIHVNEYLKLLKGISKNLNIEYVEKSESMNLIWQIIIDCLQKIDAKLCQNESERKNDQFLKLFSKNLLNPLHAKMNGINAENENESFKLVKNKMISALVQFGDEHILQIAADLMTEKMKEKNCNFSSIHFAESSVLIKAALSSTNDDFVSNVFEHLMNVFSKCDKNAKKEILNAFEAVQNEKMREKAYKFIIDEVDDHKMKLNALRSLSKCMNKAWIWDKMVKDGVWNELYSKLHSHKHHISKLIEIPMDFVPTFDELKRIQTFFYEFKEGEVMEKYGKNVNKTLEQMECNAYWMEKNNEKLAVEDLHILWLEEALEDKKMGIENIPRLKVQVSETTLIQLWFLIVVVTFINFCICLFCVSSKL